MPDVKGERSEAARLAAESAEKFREAAERERESHAHAFLDEFALTYHRAVADRLRAEPSAV